jgi:hypothetical protein
VIIMVFSRRTGLFWLAALVISLLVGGLKALDDKVAGMLRNFRESKEGYITVKNDEFNLLVDGPSRPYHVCVFADSSQHRNSPKLELGKRLKYLGAVSKSILKYQSSTEEVSLRCGAPEDVEPEYSPTNTLSHLICRAFWTTSSLPASRWRNPGRLLGGWGQWVSRIFRVFRQTWRLCRGRISSCPISYH